MNTFVVLLLIQGKIIQNNFCFEICQNNLKGNTKEYIIMTLNNTKPVYILDQNHLHT